MNLEGSGNTAFPVIISSAQEYILDRRLEMLAELPINNFTADMLDALNEPELKTALYVGIESGLIPEEFMTSVVKAAIERHADNLRFIEQVEDLFDAYSSYLTEETTRPFGWEF